MQEHSARLQTLDNHFELYQQVVAANAVYSQNLIQAKQGTQLGVTKTIFKVLLLIGNLHVCPYIMGMQ